MSIFELVITSKYLLLELLSASP